MQSGGLHHRQADESRQDDQVAMGDVDQAHDAEDQRETGGEQRVKPTKQYALDYGKEGIRSNAVNADRVRTGLFTPEVIKERSAARGLTPDDYFKNNLLEKEVFDTDVAQGFLDLALAEKTTGSVITIDGGNIAASPR